MAIVVDIQCYRFVTTFAKNIIFCYSVFMYEDILKRIGLSPDEARVYEILLQQGPQRAGELVKKVQTIKRSLLYKVLDRLVERGLVLSQKKDGKLSFAPQSPDLLLTLAEEEEDRAKRSRESLASALPELKAKYNLSTERPVLRFFEGIEGLKEMQEDKLVSGMTELHFVRSSRAKVYQKAFGAWFSNYLRRQSALNVPVYALTVDDEDANHNPEIDRLRHVTRTWLRPGDYTAPIEMATYAGRVSITSYGKEIFGIIIESAPLAQAFRDMMVLADLGAKTLPITHDHPPAKPSDDPAMRKKNIEV